MADQPSEGRVFLSYSHADRDAVARIADHLDRRGFDVIREFDIPAGERWTDQIQHAIATCDALVAVVSDDYMKSEWAQTETALALGSDKRVLPVMVQTCQPTGIIGHFNMLDATADLDEGARTIGDLLGERET